MRQSSITNAVSSLLVISVLAVVSVHGAEVQGKVPIPQGKAPITLGPGVTAVNVEEPFEYFTNPWTVIGLKDYPSGTRVSPRGEFLLSGGLTVRPLVGESLVPLHRRIAKTLRKGWLPIVKMDFVLNSTLRITIEAFAESFSLSPPGSSPQNYRNCLEATLQNVGKDSVRGRIAFEWRPEQGLRLRPLAKGSIFPGPYREWAIAEAAGKALCSFGIPEGGSARAEGSRIVLDAPLSSGDSRTVLLCIPFEPVDLGGGNERDSYMSPSWKDEDLVHQWEGLPGKPVSLTIPEKKVEETFKASLVYQFIGRDGKELHAGEGFYDGVYIRDGAYQALSLAHAGFLDEAREALEVFLRYQTPDGQFVSQRGQLDANGYAMWAPVELAKLSGDLEYLRRSYGPIKKAAEWAMKDRRTEKDPSSPFFGVLPAAIADGEYLWAGKNHILGYDFWNLRGIACVAEAARRLGETADAEVFEKEVEEYRKDILKALDRTGLPWIPPSYEKEGTHWGNLEVVFPTPLIDPHDGRVSATLAHVRNDFGAPDGPKGLIEGTMQWSPGRGAIHPYMSQFVTNTHIIRGEQEEAVDGFYSFLLHTTSTNGFPEGVHFQKREAWGNTVPHLWAAALYVTTLRNMLVREEGDELHLLSAVPAGWLDAGECIDLDNVPTHFGRVYLGAYVSVDEPSNPCGLLRVQLARKEKDRPAPRRMVIHLPPSFGDFRARTDAGPDGAGGTPLDAKDGTIAISGDWGCCVWIDFTRDRSVRPVDFAAKVASYLATAPDLDRPIPGLVLAPPAGVDEKDCVKLDLASAATTNPLERPFVANGPIFSGIPVGDAKAAGFPFRTLDPAKSGGKALVVLQGASTCAGLPKEAVVAAGGVQGKLLAILGNVTGWGPGDPGTGPWGAVAEYEIRYADGTRQTVPLITGWTCDDWLGDPGATEAAGVLQVAHWHLNVLAIALEPKAIESVVIRDLGTPASPVVAAMTVLR